MRHTAHVCHCVPAFVPNIRDILEEYNTTRACNFYEYGTCVSYVRSYFDVKTMGCLPACASSKYVTTSIQVNSIK